MNSIISCCTASLETFMFSFSQHGYCFSQSNKLIKSRLKSSLRLQPTTHVIVGKPVPQSILDRGRGLVPSGARQPLVPHRDSCSVNTLPFPGTPTPGCGTALAWRGERVWVTLQSNRCRTLLPFLSASHIVKGRGSCPTWLCWKLS